MSCDFDNLPGRFGTDRLLHVHGSMEEAEEAARADVPIGRLGTVDEVAAVTWLLVSDAGAGITGTSINVDGGTSPH